MTDPVILCCARIYGELLLPDNERGKCAECGFPVQYRPHAPKPHILRCMKCVAEMIEEGDEVTTTDKMIADLERYFRSKKQ